jgi:hypothetical protein
MSVLSGKTLQPATSHVTFPAGGYTAAGSDLVVTNEWCHLAAVTGPEGMKLYFNSALVGFNLFTGSFSAIKLRKESYLGRSAWKSSGEGNSANDADFQGQMDEVRVWSVARTSEQIRATMFQSLTGQEPGLVSLWNFETIENGVVRDVGPGRNDGQLKGNAKAARGELPKSVQPIPFLQEVSIALGEEKPSKGGLMLVEEIEDGRTRFSVVNGVSCRQLEMVRNGNASWGHMYFAVDPLLSNGDLGLWRLRWSISTGLRESGVLDINTMRAALAPEFPLLSHRLKNQCA